MASAGGAGARDSATEPGPAALRKSRALGYQSQSAFSAMFRRAFGESPRAFFVRDGEPRDDSENGGTGER